MPSRLRGTLIPLRAGKESPVAPRTQATGTDGRMGRDRPARGDSGRAERPGPAAAALAGPASSPGGELLTAPAVPPNPAHLPAAAASTAVRASPAPPYLSRARRERRVRVPSPPPPPPARAARRGLRLGLLRVCPPSLPCPCPCPQQLTQTRGRAGEMLYCGGTNDRDAQGAERSAGWELALLPLNTLKVWGDSLQSKGFLAASERTSAAGINMLKGYMLTYEGVRRGQRPCCNLLLIYAKLFFVRCREFEGHIEAAGALSGPW